MDKKIINRIIINLKDSLSNSGIKVNNLALFGSTLKGKQTEESDIDLIIISNDFKNKDIFERTKMTMKAEIEITKEYHIPFDILTMTPEEYKVTEENRRFESKIVA